MDFATISSLNSYTRMAKMEMQWNERKKSYAVEGRDRRADALSITDNYQSRKQTSGNLLNVSTKMAAGQKLTYEERRLLRERDPEAYQALVDKERRQKQYEKDLKSCRTREQARALRVTRLASIMDKLKNANGDMKVIMECKAEAEMDADTYHAFAKSREYKDMPKNAPERAELDAQKENAPKEETRQAAIKAKQKAGEGRAEVQQLRELEEAQNAEKEQRSQQLVGAKPRKRHTKSGTKPVQYVAGLEGTGKALKAYAQMLQRPGAETPSLFVGKA